MGYSWIDLTKRTREKGEREKGEEEREGEGEEGREGEWDGGREKRIACREFEILVQ